MKIKIVVHFIVAVVQFAVVIEYFHFEFECSHKKNKNEYLVVQPKSVYSDQLKVQTFCFYFNFLFLFSLMN